VGLRVEAGDAPDASVTRVPDTSEWLVLAALLHDIGKPATAADGHFIGHAEVGARMAADVLQRLRWSAAAVATVALLIREHMFQFRPAWTDAAAPRDSSWKWLWTA